MSLVSQLALTDLKVTLQFESGLSGPFKRTWVDSLSIVSELCPSQTSYGEVLALSVSVPTDSQPGGGRGSSYHMVTFS